MGYHIRTGLVKEHEDILTLILSAVDGGKSLSFPAKSAEHMNKMKYQFYRVLKASTVLIQECGGRFVGLRQRVKIREDWLNQCLLIEPATPHTSIAKLVPTHIDEVGAIEELKQFTGQMQLLRFTPSYTFVFNDWVTELTKIGFGLMMDPDDPDEWIGGLREDGDMEYAVQRTSAPAPTGFGMLSAFDQSGDMNPDT